jgi:hypothetical protein
MNIQFSTPERIRTMADKTVRSAGRKKCAILRNEPILFLRIFHCIILFYRNLCRLQRRLQMGSFWKNEPIFGCL